MAQPMREKRHADAFPHQLFDGAVAEDPQVQEPLHRDLVRAQVERFPVHAGLEEGEGGALHAEDEGVDGAGGGVEGAPRAEGHRARDVGAVAVPFGAGVDEDVGAGGEGLVVVLVVQGGGVFAAAEDAVVGLVFGAVGDAAGGEDGFEVLFVAGGGEGAEDGGVGGRGDGVGLPDESDFVGVFGHAAFVDGGVEEFGIGGHGGLGNGEQGISRDVFEVKSYVGVFLRQGGQVSCKVRVRETVVDVVDSEGFSGHQR